MSPNSKVYVRGHSDQHLSSRCPRLMWAACQSSQGQDWTQGSASSWKDRSWEVTVAAQPWRTGASLVTVTEEGLSQPVEGIGSGSNKQLRGVGGLTGPSLSTPLPLVSRFNYPKLLLIHGQLRVQPCLKRVPQPGPLPGMGHRTT